MRKEIRRKSSSSFWEVIYFASRKQLVLELSRTVRLSDCEWARDKSDSQIISGGQERERERENCDITNVLELF